MDLFGDFCGGDHPERDPFAKAYHAGAAMTNDSQVNTVPAVRTNKRKANCADCRRLLQKGEGVAHSYAMFHGTGEFYYLCPGCDRKRKESK